MLETLLRIAKVVNFLYPNGNDGTQPVQALT
jgi:hypothetical protein